MGFLLPHPTIQKWLRNFLIASLESRLKSEFRRTSLRGRERTAKLRHDRSSQLRRFRDCQPYGSGSFRLTSLDQTAYQLPYSTWGWPATGESRNPLFAQHAHVKWGIATVAGWPLCEYPLPQERGINSLKSLLTTARETKPTWGARNRWSDMHSSYRVSITHSHNLLDGFDWQGKTR